MYIEKEDGTSCQEQVHRAIAKLTPRQQEIVKLENEPNKEQEREVGTNCKNKNATIKIKLMIERARQKNSAPIAKRVSGDGAFCLFNSFIFV